MSKNRQFTILYNDMLQSDKLTNSEFRVFVALRSFADSKTLKAYPTLKKLSEVTGIADRHIRTYLRRLEEIGAIKTEFRKSDKGDFTSSIYTLNENSDFWNAKTEEEETAAAAAFNEDLMIKALEARGYVITKPDAAEQSEGKRKGLEAIVHPTKETIETSPISKNSYSDNSTYHYSKPFPPKCQEETTREDSAQAETETEQTDPLAEFCRDAFDNIFSAVEVRTFLNEILPKIGEGAEEREIYLECKKYFDRYRVEQRKGEEIKHPYKYIMKMIKNDD